MSLRPPSSPSPSPGPHENGRSAARQSLGPSTRGTPNMVPASPRTGVRPTSELVVPSSAMFQQTAEADVLDQWFENLQNYDATLEEMAAASMDVNFKEELSAIEQWFKVLSEAERTAALYSLLQHSTQVQIRFFITVLQQMARSDPMTALFSPAVGGSMQSQMDAKLASLKSPGLKSGLPASPTARNFGGQVGAPSDNRQSLVLENTSNYLSPDSAALPSASDPATTLAQQRAKFNASNAAHRISAPVLASGADGRGAWGGAGQLSQVAELNGSGADAPGNGTTSRPKSTEFTGSPRPAAVPAEQTITTSETSWANMVNTPLIPMFEKQNRVSHLDQPQKQPTEWSAKPTAAAPGVPRMGDPTIHRRRAPDHPQEDQQGRFRNEQNNNRGGWGNAARSPVLNNNNNMGGMPMPGFGGMGMGMAGMGSPNGMNGMGMMPGMGMNPMPSPFGGLNMNMLNAMGITPEAAVLAAQMAAGGFGQPGWMGMQPPNSGGLRGRNGPPSARSSAAPMKSANSVSSIGGGTPKDAEDVDPTILHDIPAWLRSLRLHKYTPNFETMRWQDMVLMDEAALEAKGVAALGARRKMLKTFELVRKKMGIEGGPPSSLPPSATLKSP